MIEAYAYMRSGGALSVKTVSESERAAKVNAVTTESGTFINSAWDDIDINNAFDKYCAPYGSIVEVLVTVKEERQ